MPGQYCANLAEETMTYGCHNHAEYVQVAPMYHSKGRASFPFQFSTDKQCQYELSETEPKCAGCRWIAGGDKGAA